MATAQDVIDRVREVINDNANAFITTVRWSDTELLRWITDAQREVVKVKPESYALTRVFAPEPNMARQRLDSTLAYRLIRVEANAIGDEIVTPVSLVDEQFHGTSNGATGALSVEYAVPAFDDPVPSVFVVVLAFFEAVSNIDTLIDGLTLDGVPMTVHSVTELSSTTAKAVVAYVAWADLPYSANPMLLTTGDPTSAAAGTIAIFTLQGVDRLSPNATSADNLGYVSEYSDKTLTLESSFFAAGQAVLAAYAQSNSAGDSGPYGITAGADSYTESTQMAADLQDEPFSELRMTAQTYFGRPTDPMLRWFTDGDGYVNGGFAVVVSPTSLRFGDTLRIVERDVLDSFRPSWTRSPSTERENYYRSYCMDANDPLGFWLVPCPDIEHKVWVTYAGVPATLDTPADLLSLSDMYIAPVVDYTVYRGLTKESREANREVAERYLRSFYAALGVHRPVLQSIGQNAARAPDAEA